MTIVCGSITPPLISGPLRRALTAIGDGHLQYFDDGNEHATVEHHTRMRPHCERHFAARSRHWPQGGQPAAASLKMNAMASSECLRNGRWLNGADMKRAPAGEAEALLGQRALPARPGLRARTRSRSMR